MTDQFLERPEDNLPRLIRTHRTGTALILAGIVAAAVCLFSGEVNGTGTLAGSPREHPETAGAGTQGTDQLAVGRVHNGAAQGKVETPSLHLENRDPVIEGAETEIRWRSSGVLTVVIRASGDHISVGGKSRGGFELIVCPGVAAAQGHVRWRAPWLDAIGMTLKVKGYDSSGHLAATDDRELAFRPRILASRTADGIYLDLHQRRNQRLYVQRNGTLLKAYLATSSAAYRWVSRNRHPRGPHDHAGVFTIREKEPWHYSRLYRVGMRWSMRYTGGHFIHATSARYYRLLGQAASHGCNRLTGSDARELYISTPVGTRVEVIGPTG